MNPALDREQKGPYVMLIVNSSSKTEKISRVINTPMKHGLTRLNEKEGSAIHK